MPVLLSYALPHDTIEGYVWGQHLAWGYDKNPWMNAWLTRLGWELGGSSTFGIYFLTSLFVGLAFWSIWELGKQMLEPVYALIAVLLLEGCINYTLVPQGFNDNSIELGLWPLMFLCFYKAVKSQQIKYWIATGLVVGLGMMTKYIIAFPLAIMGLFLLIRKEGRDSFVKPGIYLSALTFLVVIFPHVIWLFQHNFITIAYAFGRAADQQTSFWHSHFHYPLSFILSEVLIFLLPAVVFLLFFAKKIKHPALSSFDKSFLLTMAFGPLILIVLLAMILSWHLYSEWGFPLLSLWSLVLVAFTQPKLSEKSKKLFLIVVYTLMFLWVVGYSVSLIIKNKHTTTDNYPAQQIANYVTQQWQQRYHTPLKYVIGSRYIAGYVSFYSKDHPKVYLLEYPDQLNTGVKIQDIEKYGAVFVQDNYYGTLPFDQYPDTENGKQFPALMLQLFPRVVVMPIKHFAWMRGNKNSPPVQLLVGFLPPKM